MISTNMTIFIILILVFVALSDTNSRTINFEPITATYDRNDIIVKRHRISCEDYETVNLNGSFLSKIPRGFVKSSTIKSISLSNNEITEIPRDVFSEVPNLECLDLSNNKLSIKELLNFGHDHLKILIFDNQQPIETDDFLSNNIEFYSSKANFPNVEVLSLKRIDYERPSLYANLFPKLSTIFWENNYLEYVNADVTDYFGPDFKVIHLERNNLKNFTVNDLKNIEELYLDDNPLEVVSFGVSSNLKTLSLAGCNLDTVRNMWLPTIITLDLSRNQITEINVQLDVENLSLSYNRFTTLPRLGDLPRLRKLSLSYNLIESIYFVGRTNTLKTLNLRGNQIARIDHSTFFNVPALEELDLAENKLYSLPYDWGISLKMLRYINLRSNKFASIADMGSSSLINLNHIYVGNNYFTSITETEIRYIPDNCTVYVS